MTTDTLLVSKDTHLAFCKDRALKVLQVNLIGDAWATFLLELNKHPDTKPTLTKMMVSMMLVECIGLTKEKFAKYITDYQP